MLNGVPTVSCFKLKCCSYKRQRKRGKKALFLWGALTLRTVLQSSSTLPSQCLPDCEQCFWGKPLASGVCRALELWGGRFEETASLRRFRLFLQELLRASRVLLFLPPRPGVQMAGKRGEMRLGAHGPQALFLHDVPQLTQVGLGDGVIGFQFKCSEVIGFSFMQLPVEVEDRPQVHQSCRILKPKERVSHFSIHLVSCTMHLRGVWKVCPQNSYAVIKTGRDLVSHPWLF